MEKKKGLWVSLCSICLAVLLTTFPGISVAAPVVIKAVHYNSKSHSKAILFQKLVDSINEKAKGEIKVDFLGGPEVIPTGELAGAVRIGSVQMAVIFSSIYEGLVPGASLTGLSQISYQEEQERGMLDLLREMHAKANLYYLGRDDPKNKPMWYIAFAKEKVTKISQMSGMKLGAPSPIPKGVAEAFGMVFVLVPYPDAYAALDGKLVDAYTVPPEGHIQFGMVDKLKYAIDHPYFVSNGAIIMNLDTWKKLPESSKKMITDAYWAWVPEAIRFVIDDDAKHKQAMINRGVQFIKFSPEEEKLFIDTAYKAEWNRQIKMKPEIAQKFMKMLAK